jgi:hypothetical protein
MEVLCLFGSLYCGLVCLNCRKIVEIEMEFYCYYGTYSRRGVSDKCIWGIPVNKILLKSFVFFHSEPQIRGKKPPNQSFD